MDQERKEMRCALAEVGFSEVLCLNKPTEFSKDK